MPHAFCCRFEVPDRTMASGLARSLHANLCIGSASLALLMSLATTAGAQNGGGVKYTTLPFVFDSHYGYPLVSVETQGATIPVSFDLGGSGLELALSPAVLKKHRITVEYTGRSHYGIDARGLKSASREYVLPKVKLGNFEINRVTGIEYHQWGGKGAPRNGVLGFELISRFNVVIDFPGAKAILIEGAGYPPHHDTAAWPKGPSSISRHMVTAARIRDKTISLIWDTGTPVSSLKLGGPIAGTASRCSSTVLFQLAATSATCKEITT